MKKITIILMRILMISILLVMFIRVQNVNAATSNVKINYIFDKKTVMKNEEFTLTIVLNNYQELLSAQLFIKTDNSKIASVNSPNPFVVDEACAIFKKSEVVVNDESDNIKRFSAYATDSYGYSTSSYNQLAKITFRSLGNYTDVSSFFKNDTWDYGYGVKLYLYNKNLEIMNFETKYLEEIIVKWDNPAYEINYGDDLPDFKKDITVVNRNLNEYRIDNVTTKDDFNQEKLGVGILKVKVFDILTNTIYYYVKSITVVDKNPPKILYNLTDWEIPDQSIDEETFSFVKVVDNYDQNLLLLSSYYTATMEEISTIDEFKEYLKREQKGYIIYHATDSSGNDAEPVTISVSIIDTTPPIINNLEDIKVKDTELDTFLLESVLSIDDNYDRTPRLVLKVYNEKNESVLDYKEVLRNVYYCEVECFAIDNSGNSSLPKKIAIILEDTTPPTIEGVNDIEISDVELLEKNYSFDKDIIVRDNFNKEVYLHKYYYLEDGEMLLYEDFLKGLWKSEKACIYYQAMDSAGNTSEKVIQRITIKDTTPPVIKLKNVEDGKKYFGISKLEYTVNDNMSNKVNVQVFLNDMEYKEEALNKIGEYTLKIIATDSAGNQSECVCRFSIIKDNLISCGDDMECYSRNYTEVIIATIVILSLVLVIITFNIINKLHKKKTKKKDNENEIIDLDSE